MVNPWPDCVCVCAYLIVRNTFVHTHTQIRKICEQKTWQESERMMMKKSIQLVEVNYGLWSVYTLQFQHAFYSTKFGKYANGQLRMRFGNDIDGRKNFEKPSTEKKKKKRQQECKQNILQLVAVWTTHVISLSIIHYEDDIWLLHQFEHWSIVTVSNVHAKFYANQMVISKNWNFERIHSARISRENQRGNANTFAQEKHICDSENPLIPKSKIRNTSRLEIAWNFRKKQIKVGRAI